VEENSAVRITVESILYMRRGEKIKFVLEFLQDTAHSGVDLFTAFLKAGYGASGSHISYLADKEGQWRRKAQREVQTKKDVEKLLQAERQRYFNLIYALKKDGLLLQEEKQEESVFSITSRGKQKLSFLRAESAHQLPDTTYPIEKRSLLTIVTFDVPESESRKRKWLRGALNRMEFTMLQRSVWVGKVKVPTLFLEDIQRLKLGACVEIFEVTKTGSLRNLNLN
jgi:CRISPR/Cas system-associated endoribonuclease Cas2